jgi:hypothetical protein
LITGERESGEGVERERLGLELFGTFGEETGLTLTGVFCSWVTDLVAAARSEEEADQDEGTDEEEEWTSSLAHSTRIRVITTDQKSIQERKTTKQRSHTCSPALGPFRLFLLLSLVHNILRDCILAVDTLVENFVVMSVGLELADGVNRFRIV